MTICYLDVDDEITNAVARLRAAPDLRVLLVLPPGSRIATSRINFRLLAREAREHQRRLSIVSGEAGVRQVAVSAGLPAYGSVPEFERAQEEAAGLWAPEDGADAADGPGAEDEASGPHRPGAAEEAASVDDGFAGGVAPTGVAPTGAATIGATAAAGLSASELSGRSSGTVSRAERPEAGTATRRQLEAQRRQRDAQREEAERRRRAQAWPREAAGATAGAGRRMAEPVEPTAVQPRARAAEGGSRRTLVAAGLAIVALLLVLGGAGAYLLLPRADITITPTGQQAGPVSLTVRADPRAEAVDSGAGVVPAALVEIPLSVNGEFPATGVEVATTRAAGSVRFQNKDPSAPNNVPSGSIVSTDSNIRFATQAAVVVPRARLIGFTIIPGEANVEVRAVDGGPAGNVPANAIHNVPPGENPELLAVTNPDATTGGSRTETRFVQQRDYDGAVAALSARFDEALATALADPRTTPAGLTLFPETAVRGRATADPAPAELVRKEVERFSLSLSATAAATAVDETQLDALATERLKAAVPDGWQLFEDSVRGRHEPGRPDGRIVVYRVEAEGEQWRPVDGATLLDEVKGLPVAEARSRLERHGRVTIDTWPDWVSSIPSLDARLSLTIASPERLSP